MASPELFSAGFQSNVTAGFVADFTRRSLQASRYWSNCDLPPRIGKLALHMKASSAISPRRLGKNLTSSSSGWGTTALASEFSKVCPRHDSAPNFTGFRKQGGCVRERWEDAFAAARSCGSRDRARKVGGPAAALARAWSYIRINNWKWHSPAPGEYIWR